MILLFIKGFLMGLAIAAPVGPIGALCISRTLNLGFRAGLFTGLGAATADAVYGLIAALGLLAISKILLSAQHGVQLIGGAFLIYLGVKLFISKTQTQEKSDGEKRLLSMFASTFFLTLMNPATILSFLAIFSSVNLNLHSMNHLTAFTMVLGVFLGSATWWFFLAGCIASIHHRLSQNNLNRINQASGLFILGFGVLSVISTFK